MNLETKSIVNSNRKTELEGKPLLDFISIKKSSTHDKEILINWIQDLREKDIPFAVEETEQKYILWKEDLSERPKTSERNNRWKKSST